MFLCGLAPVIVSVFTLLKVHETKAFISAEADILTVKHRPPLLEIFGPKYLRRTLVNSGLLTIAIVGLWAGAVYVPSAVSLLAKNEGFEGPTIPKLVSIATAVLSIGTILGCIVLPVVAETIGRRKALAIYFAIMLVAIPTAFGWAFYLKDGLVPFIAVLFVLGFGGGNFAVFSLWLPEQYETRVRATAFAFATSVGRFIGAAVNFALGWLVATMGTIGTPVALTAGAFVIGIALIPLAIETRGETLPS